MLTISHLTYLLELINTDNNLLSFFMAIFSAISSTSSGVCVFGVISKEIAKSLFGSGLNDIFGVSLYKNSFASSSHILCFDAVCFSTSDAKRL